MLHASVTDDQFVDFANLATARRMTKKELLNAIIVAELHKLSNKESIRGAGAE
jgi:hypothetical protein